MRCAHGTRPAPLALFHSPQWIIPAPLLRLGCVAVCLAAVGCTSRPEPTTDPAAAPAQSAKKPDPGSLATGAPPRETWDVVYLADTRVGTIHTLFERLPEERGSQWKIRSISRLRLVRSDEIVELETDLTSWETPEGVVESFVYRTVTGPTPIVVEGRRSEAGMRITTVTTGKETHDTLPWDDSIGGFFAAEQSLRTKPMTPGEQRALKMLMPGFAGVQVVTGSLQAENRETVSLLNEQRELLRINHTTQLGGMTIEAQCWTDAHGEILKAHIPLLGQTVYRVSAQEAGETDAATDFDLARDLVVRLTAPLTAPHTTPQTSYRVRLQDENPDQVFVSDTSQSVLPLDEHSAIITVIAVRPDTTLQAEPSPPTQDDSLPNHLIESDDPVVVELVAKAVQDEQDPWRVVTRLEQWVHGAIKHKGYAHGFATAADVARMLEGDCTEHAVLLAAMCRATGIPARVAVGLVYSPADQGFAFHMWNEAWVTDRWIPLDATLGMGGIGSGHLKLGVSDLGSEQTEGVMLRVLRVIQRLSVEVVEADPPDILR